MNLTILIGPGKKFRIKKRIVHEMTFVLLALLYLSSCHVKYRIDDGIKPNFKNHFPAHYISSQNVNRSYIIKTNGVSHVGAKHALIISDSAQILKSYVDSLQEISIKPFSYSDSCLLIIPERLQSNVRIGSIDLSFCESNEREPVPNLDRQFKRLGYTASEINETFLFYLLERQSGIFLSEKRLISDIGLPGDWTHGYSKGFGENIDETLYIFWIDIW